MENTLLSARERAAGAYPSAPEPVESGQLILFAGHLDELNGRLDGMLGRFERLANRLLGETKTDAVFLGQGPSSGKEPAVYQIGSKITTATQYAEALFAALKRLEEL